MSINYFLIMYYRLITYYERIGKQQPLYIHESIDEMRHFMANTTLNMCCGGR
jgi:hypothetical protein